MFRQLYVFHRWLGIAGGVLVLIWYATGLYLHWRALPSALSPNEQARALGEPFRVADAGTSFSDVLRQGDGVVREIQLRRAGERLVYSVQASDRYVLDARDGARLSPVDEGLAREIARTFTPGAPVGQVELLRSPDAYSYGLRFPLYRATSEDRRRTTIYIDPATASIVLRVRNRERAYVNLGSKPHLLDWNVLQKPPYLREALLFILGSLVALSALSGVAVICAMIARRGVMGGIGRSGVPMRKWHYILALAFSIPTLLFIGSGFFYVLSGSPPPSRVRPTAAESERVLLPLDPASVRVTPPDLANPKRNQDASTVSRVVLKAVVGVPLYEFHYRDGVRRAFRADTGAELQIDRDWIERVARAFLRQDVAIGEIQYLDRYDAYYYARNNRFPPLPAYRVRCSDPDGTLLYLSAATGEVAGRAPRSFRIFRWLVSGFHAWDWPWLLERPLARSLVVSALAAGGIGLSFTGLFLGASHLRRRASGPARARLLAG